MQVKFNVWLSFKFYVNKILDKNLLFDVLVVSWNFPKTVYIIVLKSHVPMMIT